MTEDDIDWHDFVIVEQIELYSNQEMLAQQQLMDEYEQGLKKEQERLQRQILENQELLDQEGLEPDEAVKQMQ